uniref:Essential for reactive oxygen species protein n=1 Tax=Coturnix japonica TaxID=93934 RepID=A0A8C2UGD9_COTJA
MYMLIETRTSSLLHLMRSPGIRSWSVFVGIASIGLAAAYYSADSLAWKLFYVAGCFFVAAQNLEQWEEAVFDKKKGTVCLKTFNLYKKILTFSKGGSEQVMWKQLPSLSPVFWNWTEQRAKEMSMRAAKQSLVMLMNPKMNINSHELKKAETFKDLEMTDRLFFIIKFFSLDLGISPHVHLQWEQSVLGHLH